jgi:hypothetical protein
MGRALVFGLSLAALAGCGGSTIAPDPAVAPFVGTWDAEVFVLTAQDDPSIEIDILEFGAFYITIEPSGQYTATLEHPFGAAIEIGQLTVIGSTIRLDPSIPANAPTATSSFAFSSADYLVLDGSSQFDFNADGTPEAATAHIELRRR